VSQWEAIDPSSLGRPRRRLYRLTSTGLRRPVKCSQASIEEYSHEPAQRAIDTTRLGGDDRLADPSRLPPSAGLLVSRLEEEWLADLASRSSAWSRLRFAMGCCWASLVIVSEVPRSRVPAASSAGARGIIALADGPWLLFQAFRHAISGCGLACRAVLRLITTLSHTRGSAKPPDLQNQVLETCATRNVAAATAA